MSHRLQSQRLCSQRTGKQTDVAYQEVAEVRTAPRGLGAWGDMVVVLRNGDKVRVCGGFVCMCDSALCNCVEGERARGATWC